ALAAMVRHVSPFDLLLFGTRTADSDTGQVGPQTAVLLDIPMVTGVTGFDATDSALTVDRQIDGFQERYQLSAPAALTIHPSAAQPRDPALVGLARHSIRCP
uniref:electron transfer flavoprotein subunit beta/FixA family protein n=1 Tax=Desulfosarcina cetonica TaxID=90730 RepID=UPI003BEEC9DC